MDESIFFRPRVLHKSLVNQELVFLLKLILDLLRFIFWPEHAWNEFRH
jgi:hypothetical protein